MRKGLGNMEMVTCQRWLPLRHCGRCCGGRVARSPTGSRLSPLSNGAKTRRLGVHSNLRQTERGREGWRRKYEANPRPKVHTALRQNQSDNKGGIPMNQLSCAVKACSSLEHGHQVITKISESRFPKRQACKKG